MQVASTLRRNTHTFLTHLFGPGLDDDRYVIERFQSKADGEIRPRGRNGSSKMGRGKASREIASLSTVQRMRPERDEIIICTGVNCTTLGVQYWGEYAYLGSYVAAMTNPSFCNRRSSNRCNIISRTYKELRKAISPLFSFHGRIGPGSTMSQIAIALAFISRSISA